MTRKWLAGAASITLAAALVVTCAPVAISAPAPKPGAPCAKAGATAKDAQGRALVCAKGKGGKLAWRLAKGPTPTPTPAGPPFEWSGSWDTGWRKVGTAPACPAQLSSLFTRLPFDADDVTEFVRPGYANPQSGYKAHGHVRYSADDGDGVQRVIAPADGWLFAVGRYREAYTPGNDQVILDFFTDCGVMWRFDHLRDGHLSPQLQGVVDAVELREDSRTTRVQPVRVKAGDVIATAVGASSCEVGRPLCIAPGGPNYFFDFGVYDPRRLNDAAQADPGFLANARTESHKGIGLCWPDLFPAWAADLGRLATGASDFCRVG